LILIQKIEILIYDLHSIRTTITEDWNSQILKMWWLGRTTTCTWYAFSLKCLLPISMCSW
jgi:hypothetical protein